MRAQIYRDATKAEDRSLLANFDFLADEYINRADLGRDILDIELLTPASNTISLQFEDQPLTEARLRAELAEAYDTIGIYDKSEDEAARSYALAVDNLQISEASLVEFAERYATSLYKNGRVDDAIELIEKLFDQRTAISVFDEEGALSHIIGSLYYWKDEIDNNTPMLRLSESHYLTALECRRREFGADHILTIDTEYRLGSHYQLLRRFDDADRLFNHSLQVASEKLSGSDPTLLEYRSRVAGFYHVRGQYRKVEPIYRSVYDAQRMLLGEEHAETRRAATALAYMLFQLKQYDETESIIARQLEIEERILGLEHTQVYARQGSLAKLLATHGRHIESARLYKKAVKGLRRVAGPDHQLTLKAESNSAANLSKLGRYREAEIILHDVLGRVRETLGDSHHNAAFTLTDLANSYADQSRFAEAEPLYKEMMEVIHAVWPNGHMFEADGRAAYGACLFGLGKYDGARRELEQARSMYAEYLGQSSDFVQQIDKQLLEIEARTSN